jgi:hypothetical protein
MPRFPECLDVIIPSPIPAVPIPRFPDVPIPGHHSPCPSTRILKGLHDHIPPDPRLASLHGINLVSRSPDVPIITRSHEWLSVLLQFEPSLSSRTSLSESIANKFLVLLSSSRRNSAAQHVSELLVISARMLNFSLATFRWPGTGTVTRKINTPSWSISGREHCV